MLSICKLSALSSCWQHFLSLCGCIQSLQAEASRFCTPELVPMRLAHVITHTSVSILHCSMFFHAYLFVSTEEFQRCVCISLPACGSCVSWLLILAAKRVCIMAGLLAGCDGMASDQTHLGLLHKLVSPDHCFGIPSSTAYNTWPSVTAHYSRKTCFSSRSITGSG